MITSSLIATVAAVPAAAKRSYRLAFSGDLTVTHTDAGLQANGAECGLGTPDDTSPFQDHYTLGVSWRTAFTISFSPGRRRRATITARSTHISGSHFGYYGFAFDFSCDQIVYGPAGSACTGALELGGPGSVEATLVPARTLERLAFVLHPFGALAGSPVSCTVGVAPQVTYEAADELGLGTLGGALAAHTFKLTEPLAAARAKTIARRIDRRVDCSQPSQSPGESDTCTTVYAGRETLLVGPR